MLILYMCTHPWKRTILISEYVVVWVVFILAMTEGGTRGGKVDLKAEIQFNQQREDKSSRNTEGFLDMWPRSSTECDCN